MIKATQITIQPPPKDGDELGSDTTRGSSAYKEKYIYIDYIYIYKKIVIKAVEPAKIIS